MVGVRGFEPPTPSSRTRCATRLRYTPIRFVRFFKNQSGMAGQRLAVPGLISKLHGPRKRFAAPIVAKFIRPKRQGGRLLRTPSGRPAAGCGQSVFLFTWRPGDLAGLSTRVWPIGNRSLSRRATKGRCPWQAAAAFFRGSDLHATDWGKHVFRRSRLQLVRLAQLNPPRYTPLPRHWGVAKR